MKGHVLDKRERRTLSEDIFPIWYLQYQYPAAKHSLNAFFNQQWFGRIWVLQEVARARKVHIFWGGHYLEWPSLEPIATTLVGSNAGRQIKSILDGCYRVRQISNFRERYQTNRQLPFAMLMMTCVGFKASGSRDKIFALQGNSNNPEIFEHPDMSPNYTRSVQEVYLDTGLYMLLRAQDLEFVLPLAGVRRSEEYSSLPSWAPNVSERNGVSYLAMVHTDDGESEVPRFERRPLKH